jgi:hypothetical protein
MHCGKKQNGKSRAEYGEYVIQEVSKALTEEFGKGFSERSVRQYRQFYQMFPVQEIVRTPLAQLENNKNKPVTIQRAVLAESWQTDFAQYFSRLNWTHIQRIMRVSNPKAREYY